jgi:uncharacterized OsmC-like protein
MGISIDGAKVEVKKIMAAEPRRIAQINVILHMPELPYTDKEKKILEQTALACPVAISLSENLVKSIVFKW